jgi:hypothetical protein
VHEAASGAIVGAHEGIGLEFLDGLSEGCFLVLVEVEHESGIDGKAAHEEGFAVAGDALIDGGCCTGVAEKGDAAGAESEKVLGGGEAGAAVVDANEIVMAAAGVGEEVAIEEDDGDAGFVEGFNNPCVGEVVGAEGFEGGEENARDFAGDILAAKLERMVLAGAGFVASDGATPEEGVLASLGGVGHSLADGLEDLGLAQIGYEEAERKAARSAGRVRLDVSAGAGTALDEAKFAEVADGSANGDAGGIEAADERGFTGEAVAGLELSRDDLAAEFIEDALELGDIGARHGD